MEITKMLAPVIYSGARSGIKRTKNAGVTIHNTDNFKTGAGAKNHGTYLQNSGSTLQASWHYAVDDKMITQSIPDNEVAWHAGDGYGNGNMTTIAIEICVNPDSNLEKATDNAAWLAAKLLKAQGLDHQSLYQHHDWSGKNCPSQIRANKPYSWAKFVSKVKGYLQQNNAASKPKPDQILNKGDKFIFPDVYQVSKVSASRDAVICYALTGTPVAEYHWLDAAVCDEVTKGGKKSGDQVLQPGEYVKIKGTYTVLDNDPETDSVYAKVGRRKMWIYAKPLREV